MDNATRATLSKEELKLLDTYEFVKRTDEKSLRRRIQDIVDLAKCVRKEDLAKKRERLRTLLTEEEKQFEEEYVAIVRAKVDNDIQERLQKLVAIQKEHGRENTEFVQLKKVQQYINNCDDIRLQLRKNLLHDTKLCQLVQIEDKHRKALEEKEHTRTWEEIAQRRSDEKARAEECKELNRREQMLKDREVLKQQVEYTKQLEEQLRKEEMEDRLRTEEKLKMELELEKKALAGEAGKRLQQAKLLQTQLIEAMELKKKRIANEIAFDRMYEKAIEAQFNREQAEIAAKVNRLKDTTLTYLQYLRDLKNEGLKEEREHARALREFQRNANKKREKQFKEAREQKAAKAKKAHEELLSQICDNQIRQMKENEEERLAAQKQKELWAAQARQDEEKQRARELFAWNYGKELKEQIAAIKVYQAEQAEQFAKDLEKANRDEEYCEALAKKFISGEVDYLRAHPNWSLMACECLKK